MSTTLEQAIEIQQQIPEDRRLRFSVSDYRKIAEAGILPHNPKTELINGEIFNMLPVGPPHRDAVALFADLLFCHLPRSQWTLFIQSTVELPEDNAPEPDICVARGPRRQYANRHPAPEECEFMIEVSSATLRNDQSKKLSMYAESGIRHYWILNIEDRQIEAYSDPDPRTKFKQAQYKHCQIYTESDRVEMLFPGHSPLIFQVAEVLPTPA